MILSSGDIVFVSNRRLFEGDEARFFVGRTIVCEGSLVKVEGYSFVRDLSNGQVVKKQEKRIKVLSLASPGQIVYELARDIDLDLLDIVTRNADEVLVAGPRQIMNLSERTRCGQFQSG